VSTSLETSPKPSQIPSGLLADLDARADLGPALIVYRALVLRRPLSEHELRDEVLPLVLGLPASGASGRPA
jgi:hypothetical protein